MKKFGLFLGILVVLFAAVNLLFVFLLPRIDAEFGKTRQVYHFRNQHFQTLILGNSTAMDGMDAQELERATGKTAFNFSLGGASLESNYVQFAAYLEQNQAPESVILCLSSSHINYRNEMELNPIVDYYYQNRFGKKALNDIPLFRFRWLFVDNFKKLISSAHRNAVMVNGQLRINRTIPDDSHTAETPRNCFSSADYQHKGYDFMWKIARLCQSKHIRLTILEMPCWADQQNDCADIQVSAAEAAAPINLQIINLNNRNWIRQVIDPTKDWLSRNHLNARGAKRFTTALVPLLKLNTSPAPIAATQP